MLLAGGIRLAKLETLDGHMGTDEARLALSAAGVLEHGGLPVMPSGRIYTRGLLNSYLVAPSFALLGVRDYPARLPSVLAGTLLVPLLFLLGRVLGGTAAGLAAATYGALAQPLVEWSQSAWLPSIFLALFTLAAYCCYRGFVGRRAGWQVAGGACFCLALLSYEFAVLLLGGLAACLGLAALRGRRDWYRGRPTLLALGLFGGGCVLFAALALALRAGTLADSSSELRLYLSPSWRLTGAAFYFQNVLAPYSPLIVAALLGLPLLLRARPGGATFLGALLVLTFVVPSFVIQFKYQTRYALPALPLLAVVGAAGTVALARFAARWLDLSERTRAVLPGLALLAIFALTLSRDLEATVRRLQQPSLGQTWVQALRQHGLQPDDLLIAEAPTIAQFYLGRDEFYLHPDDNERYVYQASDAPRSIYTDSILISDQGDFERLVERPNGGRTVWVLSRGDRFQRLAQAVDPSLWPALAGSADLQFQTRDGWVLLRAALPLRRDPARAVTSVTSSCMVIAGL